MNTKIIIRVILFQVCMFIAIGCERQPQTTGPPVGNKQESSLKVWIIAPDNGSTYRAPAVVYILAGVDLAWGAKAGDTVTVEFFANKTRLGSRQTVWHKGIKPDPSSRKFQPMIMSGAGFGGVELCWSNVPAGSYALSAKASGLRGLSAVSENINIAISP
ncbi:MAG: hypothetical protein ABSH48_26485 [Verrucomicrobiota bacterium]